MTHTPEQTLVERLGSIAAELEEQNQLPSVKLVGSVCFGLLLGFFIALAFMTKKDREYHDRLSAPDMNVGNAD